MTSRHEYVGLYDALADALAPAHSTLPTAEMIVTLRRVVHACNLSWQPKKMHVTPLVLLRQRRIENA